MRSFLALLLLATLADASVFAQANSWVGRTILVRKHGIKIGHSDDNGKEVYLATLDGVDYRVLAEQGGWLQVKTDGGISGWFRKTDAIVLEEAVAHFTERIKQKPNDAGAYNSRATASQLQGDLDSAIKDFAEALRLDPSAYGYNNRGLAWHARKDYDKAIADFSEAIRLEPKQAAAYHNRGIAWEGRKEYGKAIADFTQAIRLEPKHASAYHNRGVVWRHKRDYDKAIADFTEAIHLEPKDAAAYIDRGLTWRLKKDYDKAIADFTEALVLEPRDSTTYKTRAATWRLKKDDEKALADFETARRLNPKDISVLNTIAWVLAVSPDANVRDGKRAVEVAKEALALDDNNAGYLNTLAAANAEVGNFDEAVRLQEQAMQDPQFQSDPAARDRLRLYLKKQPYRQE